MPRKLKPKPGIRPADPTKNNGQGKRTPFQREQHLAIIAGWHLRGMSQKKIADKLNKLIEEDGIVISQQTISNDLKEVVARWQTSAITDMNEAKNRELTRLDALEDEAWIAWERSKQDAVKQTQSRKNNAQGKAGKDETALNITKEGQVGEVSFLRLILEISKQRAAIIGFEAPKKTDNIHTIHNIQHASDEELARRRYEYGLMSQKANLN